MDQRKGGLEGAGGGGGGVRRIRSDFVMMSKSKNEHPALSVEISL